MKYIEFEWGMKKLFFESNKIMKSYVNLTCRTVLHWKQIFWNVCHLDASNYIQWLKQTRLLSECERKFMSRMSGLWDKFIVLGSICILKCINKHTFLLKYRNIRHKYGNFIMHTLLWGFSIEWNLISMNVNWKLLNSKSRCQPSTKEQFDK